MKQELTPYEKKIFAQMKRKEQPSNSLEKNIINKLKSENLINQNTFKMNTTIKKAVMIAAAVILFFAGNYFGKRSIDQTVIDPSMGYMLILHEDNQFKPGNPNEMFQEYAAWMQNTFKKGVNITGHELKNETIFINSKKEEKHEDESLQNKTTGYFVLEAKSLETVLEIAKSNPHIKYGGSIEIKKYMVR